MKKIVAIVACLAMAGAAFGLGARQSMTEEEALAAIDQKVAELGLRLEEAQAAEQAFIAIAQAGVRVREALRIVNEGLEDGLRLREMNQIAVRARELRGEGLAEGKVEEALRSMTRTMTQERVRVEEGTQAGQGSAGSGAQPAGPGAPSSPGKP